MNVYTIGFTKKPASRFFGLLRESGAQRLVDVRLNNISQLAGFAKRHDLAYFVSELCDMDYGHEVRLAPTADILDAYKKHGAGWDEYRRRFLELMAERQIETTVPRELLDDAVLLCSCADPDHCHRRLVVEYLSDRWGGVTVTHL